MASDNPNKPGEYLMIYQSTLLFLLLPLVGNSSLSSVQVVDANSVTQQDKEELTRARIADLQSSEYARRQAAMQQLAAVDFEQLATVLPLLTSEDAEVSWRAREVLMQQGVRGNPDQVRRIGLLLQLLASAGYDQFAKDALDFSSRVEMLRTRELLRKIQQFEGVQVNEGFQIVGNIQIGRRAGMVMGDGMRDGLLLQVAPRVIVIEPGNPEPQIRFLEQNEIVQDPPGVASQETPPGSSDSNQEPPTTETTIGQEAIRSQLTDWLQQCIVATPEQLDPLEAEWRRLHLLQTTQPSTSNVVTSYDIYVTRPLAAEQIETLHQFINARVLVALNLIEVELTPGWISAIAQAADLGTLQRLDTRKCIFGLESYQVLNELLMTKKLPSWECQGRAMLGIRSSSAFDRLDLAEQRELGAMVNEVTQGSAANDAGILPGDRITRVNEIPVRSFDELRRLIAAFAVGDVIQVQIARQNVADSIEVQVSLIQHTQ